MKNKIILIEDKKNCCGCSACANICPKKAITMEEDEYGFIFPVINYEKCIKCGMCKNVCAYQNNKIVLNSPLKAYAATTINKDILEKSTSGGISAQIAKNFISQNGIVYGCALNKRNGKFFPEHIRIDNINELKKIQGSKYAQSDMNDTYQAILTDLKNNKNVLFFGTPCQTMAVRKFVEGYDKNFYSIDIICHGVPSKKMFQDYIIFLENKHKLNIDEVIFRDKVKGWETSNIIGYTCKLKYTSKSGKQKNKYISSYMSSYYKLFLNSETYRENCYTCKYAGKNRAGDITIGDYWGIKEQHPEYLTQNGGRLDEHYGISCMLVNSEKGKFLMENYGKDIIYKASNFSKIAIKNSQLNEPCNIGKNRKKIMELYSKYGYSAVEKWYLRNLGVKRILYLLWLNVPRAIQKKIKKKSDNINKDKL